MREAFEPELEAMLADYCIQVLNAQSEEELEDLKQEIVVSLKECELSETSIHDFLSAADRIVEMEKEQEGVIQNDIYSETNTELGTPSSIPETGQNNSAIQGALIGGIGLGLTALISVLALKQNILNKNKENEENRTR